MRIWHKDLIPILPRQQLLAQWRECCLIAKNIVENGTPNHILVNRIMDYPIEHFSLYSEMIFSEILMRGYKCNASNFTKYLPIGSTIINEHELFYRWHNKRYFIQCYCNLQEKYDCGGITEEEWKPIYKKFMEF